MKYLAFEILQLSLVRTCSLENVAHVHEKEQMQLYRSGITVFYRELGRARGLDTSLHFKDNR